LTIEVAVFGERHASLGIFQKIYCVHCSCYKKLNLVVPRFINSL